MSSLVNQWYPRHPLAILPALNPVKEEQKDFFLLKTQGEGFPVLTQHFKHSTTIWETWVSFLQVTLDSCLYEGRNHKAWSVSKSKGDCVIDRI